jgi:hypothetical protein
MVKHASSREKQGHATVVIRSNFDGAFFREYKVPISKKKHLQNWNE